MSIDSEPNSSFQEAQSAQIKQEVSQALQVQEAEVVFFGTPGEGRFTHGITDGGFFKLGQTPEEIEQLRLESARTKIVGEVGLPVVKILKPFQETPGGHGLLYLEKLEAENGTILATPELVAGADSEYGARAARALYGVVGKRIPEGTNTSLLKRGDWRNESPETFWKVWEEQNTQVFTSENNQLIQDLIGLDELKEVVVDAQNLLKPLLKTQPQPGVEYIVTNDAALGNTFFSDKDNSVIFLDHEHAGATRYQILAQLTDLGNFYGRMWANPEMQRAFLTTFLDQSAPDNLEQTYNLLKITAVFGAMFLAKYAMSADHPEHTMSVSLLGNLKENLASLEQRYNEIKKAPNSTPSGSSETP